MSHKRDSNDWTAYAKPGGSKPPGPSSADRLATNVRCGMRQLAVEATMARLGSDFGPRAAQLARAAVRLHECPAAFNESLLLRPIASKAAATRAIGDIEIHISPSGSDSHGDGSVMNPFFSPIRARDAIREIRRRSLRVQTPISTLATVILSGGIYHLGGRSRTMELTAEDSNTQWVAASSSSQPILSGAVALENLNWTTHSGQILVATLPSGLTSADFTTLFDERTTRRLIRARHPNGDPELPSGMCFAYGGNKSLGESCEGFIKPQSNGPTQFIGRTLKRVTFNTTRGGHIAGDAVCK